MKITDNLQNILNDIKNNSSRFQINKKYMRVLKDDLQGVLEDDVYSHMQSPQGKADKIAMSINVNFLKKVVNKLSQLYTFKVVRTFSDDEELAEYYKKTMKFDTLMTKAVMRYNATKSVLVEIYYDKKYNLKIRPIANDKFYLWTSDDIDSTEAEVVIKIIEDFQKKDGTKVTKYAMFSDEQIVIVDSEGTRYPAEEVGGESGTDAINPLGFIPFVHITQDTDELNAPVDHDSLQCYLMLSSGLTDGHVANFYQAFPQAIATNIDLENSNIDRSPHSITVLNPRTGSEVTPTISFLASSLDSVKQVEYIKAVLELILDSKGLKVSSGQASAGVSSIQELISSADVTEVRKLIADDFAYGEEELWDKIALYNNYLVKNKLSLLPRKNPRKLFSEDFEVEVEFPVLDTAATTIAQAKGEEDVNGDEDISEDSTPNDVDKEDQSGE